MSASTPSAARTIIEQVIAKHRQVIATTMDHHLGYSFSHRPGVYSPFIAPSGYLTLSVSAWPTFRRRRVLDMGCGSGVFACFAAISGASHVLGIDIAEQAASNAVENVARLNLGERVSVRQGDLFAPVQPGARFDVIFANLPFTPGEPQDDLERAFYDPGCVSIRRFLQQLPDFLAEDASARAYVCSSNLERIDLQQWVPSRLTRTLVCTISVAGVELYLHKVRWLDNVGTHTTVA